MPKVPVGGAASRRARALALLAGIVLTACDVGPFLVDHDPAVTADRTEVPVETVTAFEVDVKDLMVDVPSQTSPVETTVP